MRAYRPVLVSGLLALLGLWLTLNIAVQPWSTVTLGCAALTAAAAVRALGRRPRVPGAGKRLALAGLAALALALTAVTVGLAYQRGVDLVRAKHAPVECAPAAAGLPVTAVSFVTTDGLTLRGWFAGAGRGAAVVLVHGLNGNRCGVLADAGLLWQAGFDVLLFDLRGCGESAGELVTLGYREVEDVRAAVAFVRQQPGVVKVGLLGHSLGGATVLRAAARLPEVDAVVAQSAFSSLEDNIANGVEKVVGLPAFPFAPLVVYFAEQASGLRASDVRPIDDLAAIAPRPLLLVHGALDDLMPVANAYALQAASPGPVELYILPDAGHGNLPQVGGAEYAARITTFLDRALR